jgi:hypothetical protein
MKILIACESSGTVRDAFIKLGHEAMSCDLLPTSKPGPHYQGDIRDILGNGWDMLIAHPPCTYLTNSAVWALGDVPYHQKVKPTTLVGAARRQAQQEALTFFRLLWEAPIPKVCVENPVGIANTVICKPTQIIQPHQFGEDASKGTCLWLRGLPPLRHTKHIAPRMVNGKPRWANQTDGGQNKLSPTDLRWQVRSQTYQNIADAMAQQWTTTDKTALELF